MKIADLKFVYCTNKYNKPECGRCKRNILLYEKCDEPLFWVDHLYIKHSKSPVCPFYKKVEEE